MSASVSQIELEQIVVAAAGRSPLPHLRDPQVRQRAMELACRQGLPDRIQRELTPGRPIEVLPFSVFRQFRRTGNRTQYERLIYGRSSQIDLAATACWLGIDRLAYLQGLLWAECEATTWVMPAHEGPDCPIDLRVAMVARQLATVVTLLEEQLDAEVRQRVIAEIKRRALDEFLDLTHNLWWKETTNNWNAVCHSGIGVAALLLEKDPRRLGAILGQILGNLEAFRAGFTADGGCTEGPGYWIFGFGWYVDLACALYDFTGGRINLMADPRVQAVCRYPLAAWIRPGQCLTFADAWHGYLPASLAVGINRFHRVPELFGLCELAADGSLLAGGLSDLLVCDGQRYTPLDDRRDYCLPDLAVVKVRAGNLTLGAKAGHNAEHHNHNDIGSFVVHRGRTFFLVDPGGPIYSANTFNEHRYESVFCNSFGHSVPVIGGQLQQTGGQFSGTLAVEGLSGAGERTIRIEMGGAYAVPSLQRLARTIRVEPTGRVILEDRFSFSAAPAPVEEAFMTAQRAEVAGDGSVLIRSESDGTLRVSGEGVPGRFAVAELTKESRESPRGDLLRRITFVPDRVERELTLRFTMTFD